MNSEFNTHTLEPTLLIDPSLGFSGFWTARRTLAGYEAMAMIRKGQVRNIGSSDIRTQAKFIGGLFEVAA